MKIPTIKTTETVESIAGPYFNEMEENYIHASRCGENFDFDTHMKRGGDSITKSRERVSGLFEEMRKHGYYVDLTEKSKLVFFQIQTDIGNTQIEPKTADDKKTNGKVAKYRFKIVQMVYDKTMDRKEGMDIQKKSDREIIDFFEK